MRNSWAVLRFICSWWGHVAHHIEGPAGIEVHRRGPLWWHIVQAVADTEGATAAERGAHRRTHATIGIGWRVPCLKHGGALAFAIEWLREGRGRMHGMGSLLGAPTRSVLGRLALHAAQRGPPERFLLQKPPPQRRLPLSPGPRRSTSAEMSSNTSRFNETSMPCRLLLGTSGARSEEALVSVDHGGETGPTSEGGSCKLRTESTSQGSALDDHRGRRHHLTPKFGSAGSNGACGSSFRREADVCQILSNPLRTSGSLNLIVLPRAGPAVASERLFSWRGVGPQLAPNRGQ